MQDAVDLSIVLVSHGHRQLVETCLPSLFYNQGQTRFELLVIDNTGDGCGEWARQRWPEVLVLRSPQPRSFAANVNVALRMLVRGRYFMLLNPDISCLPGLLDEAVLFMDANPQVGIMGPQLLNLDGTVQASCRSFSTPASILVRGLRLDRLLANTQMMRSYLMDDFDHAKVTDVDWVTGALMVVRRQAIEVVGGMDERYNPAYSEDQDWCCRMWQAGWRVTYVPQAKALHAHQRAGIRKPWSKMGRAQMFNAVRMFQKFGWRLSREARTDASASSKGSC